MLDAVDCFRVVISASDSQWQEWQQDKAEDDARSAGERSIAGMGLLEDDEEQDDSGWHAVQEAGVAEDTAEPSSPTGDQSADRAMTPLGPGNPALEGAEEVEGAVDVLMGAADHGDTLVEDGGDGLKQISKAMELRLQRFLAAEDENFRQIRRVQEVDEETAQLEDQLVAAERQVRRMRRQLAREQAGRVESLIGQQTTLVNIDEELSLLDIEQEEASKALKDLYRMVRRLFFASGCHRHGIIGSVYASKEAIIIGRRASVQRAIEEKQEAERRRQQEEEESKAREAARQQRVAAAKARNAKMGSTKDLPDAPDYGADLVATQGDDEDDEEGHANEGSQKEDEQEVVNAPEDGSSADMERPGGFASPSISTNADDDSSMIELRNADGLPMRGHVLISALIATSSSAGVGGLGGLALAPPTSASPARAGRRSGFGGPPAAEGRDGQPGSHEALVPQNRGLTSAAAHVARRMLEQGVALDSAVQYLGAIEDRIAGLCGIAIDQVLPQAEHALVRVGMGGSFGLAELEDSSPVPRMRSDSQSLRQNS